MPTAEWLVHNEVNAQNEQNFVFLNSIVFKNNAIEAVVH